MKYFIIISLIFAFAFIANAKTLFEQAVESGRRADVQREEAEKMGIRWSE